MVTLRQLRYLEALAETLHFGQAAKACAVTQPALSMQIKELEDELQVSLIERRKSGIELTEQGEEIVRRGRTILASATIVQMVAHGYGITLLPEMAVASEVHRRGDIRLLHFAAPEPKREIGLAWRKTSPRKADFHALATLLKDVRRRHAKS
jgi:DNA-binding transcriptional LysR family regulator